MIDVLKQALEALETLVEMTGTNIYKDAKKALRQAIKVYESAPPEAQTEAEKTAYAFGWYKALEANHREWQGLTKQEIDSLVVYPMNPTADLVKQIEAKLKDKNT